MLRYNNREIVILIQKYMESSMRMHPQELNNSLHRDIRKKEANRECKGKECKIVELKKEITMFCKGR